MSRNDLPSSASSADRSLCDSVWIKICGLTTEEGVDAAVHAGVDAIGFVFAPSRRRVTAERAAELARRIPRHVLRVAVMQHPQQALLDEVWDVFRPDVLQTDVEDLAELSVPAALQVTPVIRAGAALSMPLPARLVFEGPVSGSGAAADWTAAASIARRTQLILAGGLGPQNVAQAIAVVRPFGIDVSSGVERAPGIKDPGKILAFVGAARAAGTGGSIKEGQWAGCTGKSSSP